MLDYGHNYHEKRNPHAVLAATIDLSKAFNRVDHSLVIQDLFDMKCPSWLLRIVISYLSNRTLIVTLNGATASPKSLTAGGPQGTRLGGFIFIIKFNGALLRPPIQRPISLEKPKKIQSKCHMKYFDDVTIAAKIDLKNDLTPDSSSRMRPLSWDESSELVICSEKNTLQKCINDFQIFTSNNLLKINSKKSQILTFNLSNKYRFPPEILVSQDENLKVVPSAKILGVTISNDLKWTKNTENITSKANQKLWTLFLRKLSKMGLIGISFLMYILKKSEAF